MPYTAKLLGNAVPVLVSFDCMVVFSPGVTSHRTQTHWNTTKLTGPRQWTLDGTLSVQNDSRKGWGIRARFMALLFVVPTLQCWNLTSSITRWTSIPSCCLRIKPKIGSLLKTLVWTATLRPCSKSSLTSVRPFLSSCPMSIVCAFFVLARSVFLT